MNKFVIIKNTVKQNQKIYITKKKKERLLEQVKNSSWNHPAEEKKKKREYGGKRYKIYQKKESKLKKNGIKIFSFCLSSIKSE